MTALVTCRNRQLWVDAALPHGQLATHSWRLRQNSAISGKPRPSAFGQKRGIKTTALVRTEKKVVAESDDANSRT